ncbi:hypothetical protein EDD85DRAFT_788639 [Armillaria nabsnona]|nr:hypothetical protein EDD85DRAFT_788639 [Armillaria nabsnona]
MCLQVFVWGGVARIAWTSCKFVEAHIIGKIDARYMDCFTPLFGAGLQHNKHRAASVGAAHRLHRVRYMPFAHEPSYLLRVVNAEFERLNLFRLKAIAGAHHIKTSGGEGVGWYRNAISEHPFLGHCRPVLKVKLVWRPVDGTQAADMARWYTRSLHLPPSWPSHALGGALGNGITNYPMPMEKLKWLLHFKSPVEIGRTDDHDDFEYVQTEASGFSDQATSSCAVQSRHAAAFNVVMSWYDIDPVNFRSLNSFAAHACTHASLSSKDRVSGHAGSLDNNQGITLRVGEVHPDWTSQDVHFLWRTSVMFVRYEELGCVFGAIFCLGIAMRRRIIILRSRSASGEQEFSSVKRQLENFMTAMATGLCWLHGYSSEEQEPVIGHDGKVLEHEHVSAIPEADSTSKAIVNKLRSVEALGLLASVGYVSRQDGYFDNEQTVIEAYYVDNEASPLSPAVRSLPMLHCEMHSIKLNCLIGERRSVSRRIMVLSKYLLASINSGRILRNICIVVCLRETS